MIAEFVMAETLIRIVQAPAVVTRSLTVLVFVHLVATYHG